MASSDRPGDSSLTSDTEVDNTKEADSAADHQGAEGVELDPAGRGAALVNQRSAQRSGAYHQQLILFFFVHCWADTRLSCLILRTC